MRTEKECNPNGRFLFSDELFSDESIGYLKKEVEKRFRNRDKDELYEKFIHWKRKENEIVLFTLYAYADFKLPKTFNCLFNYDKPSEHIKCSLKLTQSLYEGWAPIDSISDGHKHLCVFEFESKIPDILNKIHLAKGERSNVPKKSFMLGICNLEDYESIRSYRENYLSLRKKHGSEWRKYDEFE